MNWALRWRAMSLGAQTKGPEPAKGSVQLKGFRGLGLRGSGLGAQPQTPSPKPGLGVHAGSRASRVFAIRRRGHLKFQFVVDGLGVIYAHK